MRDNFLRDDKVSQFGLFLWCANLAAFFCTLTNTLIFPPCTDPSMRPHIQESDVQVTRRLNFWCYYYPLKWVLIKRIDVQFLQALFTGSYIAICIYGYRRRQHLITRLQIERNFLPLKLSFLYETSYFFKFYYVLNINLSLLAVRTDFL